MFAAVLDTCTLWPSLRRDFLLSMAVERLYQPFWSEQILDELEFCEREKLLRRGVSDEEAQTRAHHLINMMRSHFQDSTVNEDLSKSLIFGLPDADDEHVVAAAAVARAGVIVTENVKDFPIRCLPEGIEIKTPAEFAADLVDFNPAGAIRSLEAILHRYRNPTITWDEIISQLRSTYQMHDACDLLEGHRSRLL